MAKSISGTQRRCAAGYRKATHRPDGLRRAASSPRLSLDSADGPAQDRGGHRDVGDDRRSESTPLPKSGRPTGAPDLTSSPLLPCASPWVDSERLTLLAQAVHAHTPHGTPAGRTVGTASARVRKKRTTSLPCTRLRDDSTTARKALQDVLGSPSIEPVGGDVEGAGAVTHLVGITDGVGRGTGMFRWTRRGR